jgi:hypothetical protein
VRPIESLIRSSFSYNLGILAYGRNAGLPSAGLARDENRTERGAVRADASLLLPDNFQDCGGHIIYLLGGYAGK